MSITSFRVACGTVKANRTETVSAGLIGPTEHVSNQLQSPHCILSDCSWQGYLCPFGSVSARNRGPTRRSSGPTFVSLTGMTRNRKPFFGVYS